VSLDYGKCTGCGLCCQHPETGKDCQYLKRLNNGKTMCTVYSTRLGRKCWPDEEYICQDIMNIPMLYDGCPYNEDKIKIILNNQED
jgi:hypothetical protein